MARIDARLNQLSAPTTTPTESSTVTATTMTAPTPTLAQTTSTTTSRTAERSSTTASGRQVTHQPRDNHGDGGDSSGDDDSSSSSDGDDDSSSDDEGGQRRERCQPVTLPGDRDFHRNRRRTIRDLDLSTFLPTPQSSVTPWIARIDFALKGARLSGRGYWTDDELYYILGNKLQNSAARWWVQLDRKLRDNERTWTRPTTLEEAVDKATKFNDPIGNVAQCMKNIGQAFVTAPDSYIVPASGTTGHLALIPGVGSTDMAEEEKLACFTNSRGVYNKYTGLWEAPKGSTWNGHMWAPLARTRAASTTVPPTVRRTTAAKTDKKTRGNMAVVGEDAYARESEDDRAAGAPYTPPPAKKPKPTRPVAEVTNDGTTCETNATRALVTVANDVNENEQQINATKDQQDVKMAVERQAVLVTDHMNGELGVRDEERAERYVSTVRSAMAALRYVHKLNDNDVGDHGDDRVAGRAAPQHTTTRTTAQTITTMTVTEHPAQVSASEEGDEVAGDNELTTGEGVTTMDGSTITESSPTDIGMELTDEKMMGARHSGESAHGADEVRAALHERRQQRDDDHDVSAEDRAHVNLVRLDSAEVSDDDDNGGMRVEASDGLPTASMLVDEMTQHVKIDSGARNSVTGTDWMMRGEQKQVDAPVMYIHGIDGFLLDVLGVWTFSMVNGYGQKVTVDACIIEGCTNEFLVGVDFLDGHRATMDFERKEVRYDERGHKVIIPFRTTEVRNDSMTAAVRLARSTNLHRRTVQSVDVAIAAPDSEEGIFLPTVNNGAVLLASTVTKVNNGKALIPAINTYGGRIRLPSRMELGVWIPMTSDIERPQMHGELWSERVQTWLDALGDTTTPLDGESDVNIGATDTRALVLKLLGAYRDFANAKEECPPATPLNIEHHIDTGNATPIMMRRRRQAQTEDAVVDSNVDTMLSAGVIEPREGAWGFPVTASSFLL
ncbi:unnamed protein product [Phytophthora fragariaefolia]|uniref:Unnamed protein product n=1 Tax=Phytophthora fragariaefolia TaxID=1490495 RepID=A0A9W7CYU9_9STRA|nr:unnamed protein product [Phytophthora fragariaefolia]